jgi:cytochrome b6-f complex iron-sulfur subunit
METTTVLLIAIPVLVVLAGVLLFAAARRRDTGEAIGLLSRETRKRDRGGVQPDPDAAPTTGRDVERATALERREPSKELVTAGARTPAPWVPPDPDALGVTRRQFMNRGIVTFMGLSLTGFGAACIAFLWPQQGGGFGSQISIGSPSDVDAMISDGSGFAYFPNGRMWVTSYPSEALSNARAAYASAPGVLEGMEAGYVALYQKCPHLGCRVPECTTSQWFECPCHGSQYNQAGEKKGGPAPRGMDRFPLALQGSTLVVDTGTIIEGPPIGTNTTGQEAEGPNCISEGGDH